MALTANQKNLIRQTFQGDPGAAPPVKGWFDLERDIIDAREDVRAVLRLDAAGSLSATLWDDVLAARVRARTAAQELVALLT